uniref:Uncharacterized protein n=1 Tax=Cucumis melo TaxID=3656 RepID=A0A9I9E6R3_CUCME
TARTAITTFLHPSRTCKGAPYLCQNGEISSDVRVARLHRHVLYETEGKGKASPVYRPEGYKKAKIVQPNRIDYTPKAQ